MIYVLKYYSEVKISRKEIIYQKPNCFRKEMTKKRNVLSSVAGPSKRH